MALDTTVKQDLKQDLKKPLAGLGIAPGIYTVAGTTALSSRGWNDQMDDIWYRPDGLAFIFTRSDPGTLWRGTHATAFDWSTGAGAQGSQYPNNGMLTVEARGVCLNAAQNECYIGDSNLGTELIWQYSLPSGFGSLNGLSSIRSVTSPTLTPRGMTINPAGSQIVVAGVTTIEVGVMSTPENLSTVAWTSVSAASLGVSSGDINGVDFSDDGTRFYVSVNDTVDKTILHYALAAPFDVNSGLTLVETVDVSGFVVGEMSGIWVSETEKALAIVVHSVGTAIDFYTRNMVG